MTTRSPLDQITRTPWRNARALEARGVKKKDAHQSKTLQDMLGTPVGTLRVWRRLKRAAGRERWGFVEHDDVTVKDARALVNGSVGEFIPRHGAPMLMGSDPAALDALKDSGLLTRS